LLGWDSGLIVYCRGGLSSGLAASAIVYVGPSTCWCSPTVGGFPVWVLKPRVVLSAGQERQSNREKCDGSHGCEIYVVDIVLYCSLCLKEVLTRCCASGEKNVIGVYTCQKSVKYIGSKRMKISTATVDQRFERKRG